MSLDTKYRPLRYADVLGQEVIVKILVGLVLQGKGFYQSYLFSGPYGSGKTTLGRILARALLCTSPVEGEPCDQCPTCQTLLKGEASGLFFEIDAATNSGKADVKRILEEIEFSTYSGQRRLYLFDEAHRLSADALDAMLKPLEEEMGGTPDKRLVCIFCTTEPEKMRDTILSRCAPAFNIRPLAPEDVAGRLAHICDQEGFEYEPEMLRFIAEATGCHVRDAIKAIEGVSTLGAISTDNVRDYLDLDLNDVYLTVLEELGSDLPSAVQRVEALLGRMSSLLCYRKLGETALMAFKASMGLFPPQQFWDTGRLEALVKQHGPWLLEVSRRLSEAPWKPSKAMLVCDLSQLHHERAGITTTVVAPPQEVALPAPPPPPDPAPKPKEPTPDPLPDPPASPPPKEEKGDGEGTSKGKVVEVGTVDVGPRLLNQGVYTDLRIIQRRPGGQRNRQGTKSQASMVLTPKEFCRLLRMTLDEMDRVGLKRGQAGRTDLDRH